ncbi:MAG: 2,3-bisphosphoglycerate-independent phosphoglycerate mutase [Bacteroidetes bacterium]|nr:MAG: 2,3-bisphosphoglycerate-independent phosphoglycerate mutase [Bacteroidota bacterium]
MKKKAILIILDGWGIGDKSKSDAVYNASTPFMDACMKKYPFSQLLTHGENVGLPEGQMGNSEVGHLNIGAGRIVYQDLVKINKEIENGNFFKHPVLLQAIQHAKKQKVNIHLMGLVSDGGVHSSQEHLHALCDLMKQQNVENVYIHAFTDGRDTDPHSGKGYIEKLLRHLEKSKGELVSVIGRYYAMDRDKRWERIKLAYDLLVHGKGKPAQDLVQAIQESYDEGITDEFIKPICKIDSNGNPAGRINPGDVVICFNFRTDRCREITIALTQQDFPEYEMKTLPLYYVTMTRYDEEFKNVHVIYEKDNLQNTLGEIVSKLGGSQIRIAETEKYPHVTFFFSGGREEEFPKEKRILIPSPKVATYDLKPEMSALEVTDAIVQELEQQSADFICLNFANCDMVGHTGVYEAIIKAVETVDKCTEKVVTTAVKNNYSVMIIADHGNADYAINPDGSPNTAHTKNPVPCIVIDNNVKKIKNGILADVAPTLIEIMQLEKPREMTGNSLIVE